MTLVFDHLFDFAELTAALRTLCDANPDIMTLEQVGTSYEGRPLWLVSVTDLATGPAHDKPAVWVDANIHSVEITGSMAALHLLSDLAARKDDADVARLLATRAFYVMPRVNPDGAEMALTPSPTYLRSSVRELATPTQRQGLARCDIDGDERVLTMRIADPNGAWKPAPEDPRLMVPRTPADTGEGPWYRLVPEGLVYDEAGNLASGTIDELLARPERRRLDLNRAFPYAWRPDGDQSGAGAFPLAEPEVRALAEAITSRPNICISVAHHTFSAAILRPYDDKPDTDFDGRDLRRYDFLGDTGQEMTGYRHVSVYHDFRYANDELITGSADSWAYDHLGVFSFTTEFWSPMAQAGLRDYHLTEWFENHPIDDDIQVLAWADANYPNQAFVDWYAFEHPQLGQVELGGWDLFRFWENAPGDVLETEIAPHSAWEQWLALTTPCLAIRDLRAERIDDDLFEVTCVVENTGYFPTNVSEQALRRKMCGPVTVTLDGATVVGGPVAVELGQLAGRERARSMVSWSGGNHDYSADRGVARWVVRTSSNTSIEVVASHDRAGKARATLAV